MKSRELNDAGEVELAISLEKVCFIIFRARELDAKDALTDPDPGSNPSDDNNLAVLEDHPDDPVDEELQSLIDNLSVDEQIDLVALMWLGRDGGSEAGWDEVRQEAARAHNEHTASYLCGSPLLADYLSDALSALDMSCAQYELDHL